MKRFFAVILVALVAIPAFAQDRGKVLTAGAPTSIRTSAIVTNAFVNSTTGTLVDNAAKAVVIYATWTKGDADGACIVPIGQVTLGGTVYQCEASSTTLVATGNYTIRVPATQFAGKYFGVSVKGTGAALTNSLLALAYRIEY